MPLRSACVRAALFFIVMGLVMLTSTPAFAQTPPANRFFELRVYTTHPGKLDALLSRFRNHTNALFEKHGMTLVGYWVPTDEKRSQNTLIYILAYPSKEARDASWKAFQDDADWKKAKAESEANGPLVMKVDSTFMTPTDFSPIR